MTPDATATATAGVVGDLPSRFMLDMDTWTLPRPGRLPGLDFYAAGRGGALGDVPSAVVTAVLRLLESGLVDEKLGRSAR